MRCRCDNELYGCSVVVKLDTLSHHLKECEHNPKKPVPCSQGCGLTVPKDEMVRLAQFFMEKCRICLPEGPKFFLGVNMRCRKDFAVGREITTSRKISN